MINTLLEHVPIKMEVNDVEEVAISKSVVRDKTTLDMAKDDEDCVETDSNETDEEEDDDEDYEDDDDDDEETDLESEALEIEQAATLLISSDEEAELEAQRIRFPVSKKSRKDSNKTSRSSSRNSNVSLPTALTSKPLAKPKLNITAPKNSIEMQQKKQIISPCDKTTETNDNNSKNKVVESVKMEDKNNTTAQLKNKKENNNMKLENVNKSKNTVENINKINESVSSSPKSRRESNNSTCSVASTVASDTAETESCGNIYVFNLQQKLIFNCEFCDLKYGDLENFGRHLHKAHNLFNFDEDPEKENAPGNMRKSNKAAASNCSNVKKEPLHILDSKTAEAPSPPPPPPVALPLSVLAEPLDSCGNVFMLNHRKLFLVCGYCECKYANLDLFEKHLRQQHRIFEGCRNEVNVVPKIEIKEEVNVTSEAKETHDSTAPQAMVAIPAEIPLDISINPENEHETLEAAKEIVDVDVDKACSPSQVAEDKGETIAETIVEKEPENKSIQNNEVIKNLVDSSLIAEKSKRKRRTTPVKPLMSPPKRPKRNTRNVTKENVDTTISNEEIIHKTTDLIIKETPETVATTNINEISEKTTNNSKPNDELKEVRKTRSLESKKPAQTNATDNKKIVKQKTKEVKKINQTVSKEIEKPKELKTTDKRKTNERNLIGTNKSNAKESVCKKKAKDTKTTINKKENENIKKEIKEQVKIERNDSTSKAKKVVQETKKSIVFKKSATKRICIENKNIVAVLEDNQITSTALEVSEIRVEPEKDNTVTAGEPLVQTKKQRRTIKAKVETESTPSLSTSPEASQVDQIQIQQLPEEAVNYDENLMHDLNTDPVNDIIEQIQNEYLQNEQRAKTNAAATAKTLTFTINTVQETDSNLEDVTHGENIIVSVKTPAGDLNSPVDVKPFLIENTKRFVCDQCPRSFKKHVRLVEHKRLHTGEKPFSCDECGKQFRIRMRLNEHKLRHSKEKKFKCEICQLACCTKQDLNLHMRHHTNDRRFQCTMCPKAFVRSSDLKIHIRVHTGEKPYVCDICHKCFRANQNLSVHKKSHMGEASKTYKCEHCEKKFMRNIDRKVHMRSHTGEKPYKCEICQRGYSSKFNVRAHIERDHISANGAGTQPRGKKKPGPKPKALREELAKQKKLIEELQQQLLQQIKTDEKIISSEEEIPASSTIQDCTITPSSPIKNTCNDPMQSAYDLLNQLKSNATTSKPLTVIPSPPPILVPSPDALSKTKKTSTTLLPLTITQKIEQHSPASTTPTSASASASVSCLTTPSPPPKTTATKVVSQKTSLGIQQVSVTVSMQVENVTPNPTTPEKENAGLLTTSSSNTASVKKERKITSYFTVLGQKAEV